MIGIVKKDMSRKLVAAGVAAVAIGVLSLQAAPERRVKMLVDKYSGYSTLENYPLLVRISPERIAGFSYDDCSEEGADISFALPDGTLLPYEVDTWNPEGESLVWVSLPEMTQQRAFYFRWRDDAPPSVDPTQVWKRARYVGVWHFGEASGAAADSTGNGYVATPQGAKADACVAFAEGMVGSARQMATTTADGATGAKQNFLTMPLPAEAFADPFTITCWMKMTSKANQWILSNKKAAAENGFHLYTTGNYSEKFNTSGGGCGTSPFWNGNQVEGFNANRWMKNDLILSGEYFKYYIDGVGKANAKVARNANTGFATDNGLAFGSSVDGSCVPFQGQVDELRFRAVESTADWMKAEHDQVVVDGFVVAQGAAEILQPGVFITSCAGEYAVDGAPSYGFTAAKAGETHVFTAPAAVDVNGNGALIATCSGWILKRFSDNSVVRTSETPSAGEDATTCVVDYVEPMILEWQWAMERHDGTITFYVSPSGDGSDGYSWKTAFRHPQAALDAAEGTAERPVVIIVGDGAYDASNGADASVISVKKSYVTVKSLNGPQKTVLDGLRSGEVSRGLTVAAGLAEVRVEGFSITNGWNTKQGLQSCLSAQSGTMSNLVISAVSRYGCNPVYLVGNAILVDSSYTVAEQVNDTAFVDGGADDTQVYLGGSAQLVNSRVFGVKPFAGKNANPNTEAHWRKVYAVGLYSANCVMRGCLVHDNLISVGEKGAKGNVLGCVYAAAGTIESCTIANNTVYGDGGGIYLDGKVTCRNNVIWGNWASHSGNDLFIASGKTPTISYCDASDLEPGVNGNLNADPVFTDAEAGDFTVGLESSLVGKGHPEDWMEEAVDLAGNPRLWKDGTVTPGAFETQGRFNGVTADFSAVGPTHGRAPFAVAFHAEASGGEGALTYHWDFGDGTKKDTVENEVEHVYQSVGSYSVNLTVTPEVGDACVVPEKPAYILAVGSVCYVREGATGTAPFDSWENASGSIEDAVALDPETVLVTNGTYHLSTPHGINLDRGMAVKSVEGRDKTFVVSCHDDGMTVRRFLTMTHADAVIDGFTLQEGYDNAIVMSAGALRNIKVTDVVRIDCTVFATVSGGLVVNCLFDFKGARVGDNNIRESAVALELGGSSVADRCEICNYRFDNLNASDGFVWEAVGGVRLRGAAKLRNSYVHDIVIRKGSVLHGGGVSVCGDGNEVANCTITSNDLYTTVASSPSALGGGLYVTGKNATIVNCAFWGNKLTDENHDLSFTGTATVGFTNNLVWSQAELPEGAVGSKTGADPKFVSGCRFANDSPCYNAGVKLGWCARKGMAKDIDGQERHCGPIDIGCWELQRPLGLTLLVR